MPIAASPSFRARATARASPIAGGASVSAFASGRGRRVHSRQMPVTSATNSATSSARIAASRCRATRDAWRHRDGPHERARLARAHQHCGEVHAGDEQRENIAGAAARPARRRKLVGNRPAPSMPGHHPGHRRNSSGNTDSSPLQIELNSALQPRCAAGFERLAPSEAGLQRALSSRSGRSRARLRTRCRVSASGVPVYMPSRS